jgi:hypothetical protein
MTHSVLKTSFWIKNGDPIGEANFGHRDNYKIVLNNSISYKHIKRH